MNRRDAMKQQMSFAEAEYQSNKRVTRRERFLNEMEQVVPWQRLVKTSNRFTRRGNGGGRRLVWSGCCGCTFFDSGIT
jgi:IS5 family transposase